MVRRFFPERLRRPASVATRLAQAMAALFLAWIALAPPASAAEDASADDAAAPASGQEQPHNPAARSWQRESAIPVASNGSPMPPSKPRYAKPRRSTSSRVRWATAESEADEPLPSNPEPRGRRFLSGVPAGTMGNPGPAWNSPAGCQASCCEDCDCDGEGCGPCDHLGRPIFGQWLPPCEDRLWVSGEYLLWWTQGSNLPPLVTTSPSGTPQNIAGRLDQSTTTILLSGNTLNSDVRSGGRVDLGYWLVPCEGLGIEGSYLALGSTTNQFQADSSNFPILARPFYNLQSGSQGQDAALVAFPGVAQGSIAVSAGNQFQVAEALVRRNLLEQCGRSIDFVAGYRYGNLSDSLAINESMTALDQQGTVPVGTKFQILDQFDTVNEFNGGELGIVFQQHCCRWSADLSMKIALGDTCSRVAINGSTTTTLPGGQPVTSAGGILALPTNIGNYTQHSLSVMPEFGVTLGYDLTCRLRATFGYTFLYWSKVVRPGDQIDTEINASQFPPGTLAGAPHPAFAFQPTDFWAQGLNFGLNYQF